ncbi:PQQ-like beta-propeller repeat protein [Yinghuangia sp. KLBMP8922]|uniref:PQQ-like beta-propeller repeat protein n=2 Tax=Yinghuangia soli TaxID=2908204 RepID=A0AA41U2I6_9ACTN|nr:PQQ-like beta-propeller repeat protein [Yinghuangia soli]
MSPTGNGKFGAVAWTKDGENCNQVGLVDLATGQKAWGIEFSGAPSEGSTERRFADATDDIPMSLTADKLVLAVESTVMGLNVADGKPAWSQVAKKDRRINALLASPDGVLVAMEEMLSDNSAVAKLDVGTGAAAWTTDTTYGKVQQMFPISVKPAVFVTSYEASPSKLAYEIVTVDDTGKVGPRIPQAGTWGKINFEDNEWGHLDGMPTFNMAVVDGVLYALTESETGNKRGLAAFDLGTGSMKWNKPAPGKAADAFHFTLAGADPAAGVCGVSGDGYSAKVTVGVHCWDKNGSVTTVADLPQPPEGVIGLNMDLRWADGRLVGVATTYGDGPAVTFAAK